MSKLDHQEYLTLCHTVRILRGSGAILEGDQFKQLEMYEATIREYQRDPRAAHLWPKLNPCHSPLAATHCSCRTKCIWQNAEANG